jgi:uncharacterized short protein YbdD (DUF466 family)
MKAEKLTQITKKLQKIFLCLLNVRKYNTIVHRNLKKKEPDGNLTLGFFNKGSYNKGRQSLIISECTNQLYTQRLLREPSPMAIL